MISTNLTQITLSLSTPPTRKCVLLYRLNCVLSIVEVLNQNVTTFRDRAFRRQVQLSELKPMKLISLGKTLATPPNPTKIPLSSSEKIKLKSQALGGGGRKQFCRHKLNQERYIHV